MLSTDASTSDDYSLSDVLPTVNNVANYTCTRISRQHNAVMLALVAG